MKMMLGNINFLVSGAEPECGGIWWDATMLATLAVPVTIYQYRLRTLRETERKKSCCKGQDRRVQHLIIR